jgi:ribosomal protein S12 methylthiotransferase
MTKRSKGKPSRKERFFILSLGCAKNTVDAHGMATLLERAGYDGVTTPEEADLVILNTCGFIEAARQESLEALRELMAEKRADQKLLVAGCWSQRDPDAILSAVPQVDGLLGTQRWMDVAEVARELAQSQDQPVIHLAQSTAADPDGAEPPRAAVQGASAYLKIAEGCSRACAFCAIPLIKGPTQSRPLDMVLNEAELLAEQGIKELILIAQDTTRYGWDLGLKDGLAQLLERMVERVPEVPWIRVMYAFPGAITPRLIDVMASSDQVLPYVDIPLQHAHPAVLRRMRRPADMEWVHSTVATLRERMPEIAIRTTFIVGYPGETEQEFTALLEFVEQLAFDRVGVFTYSREYGTEAVELQDDVPAEVKQLRQAQLMELQQGISLARNQALLGRPLDVLLEGVGDGLSVGRSYRDAPEIDGLVLIHEELEPGRFIRVQVSEALEYDLVGVPVQG